MNNYNSGMPTYANGGGLGKKIESLEAEKKKLIEEWKIATGAEKDKLYKKWQDVGIDLSYAQRDMYRNQEIEERNKMTIDFMKALEEDGIMTPGSHKNKAYVDSIKSIISMDGYEFSKYIKKVKDRKIDGIYREFQDWKQTYHSSMMANGGGVERLNRRKGESNNDMFSRMSKEVAERHEHEDWGDDYETLFKEFLAKKYPGITYTDYQNLPKKQQEKITNEYIDYSFDNDQSLGRGMRFKDGGGVDENDEYELRVDLTGKDVNGDLHWAIEYRKKGYKKPLFSNPFKKSEFDWTPLIPKGMRGVSISIGEYQETEVDTWNPLKKKYETQAERLNEKYGIIDVWGHMPYWNWPYDNKTKEYKLSVYSYYDRKDLTESIAILLSANNDKFLKEILRRKLEILQEEKEEKEALKNYKKPSYFADGGGLDMAAQGMFLDGEFEEIVRKTKDYISKYPYVWKSGNKSYVPIEGWQYAASLMGLSARVTEVYAVPGKNGWMAKAEVVNQSGVVVCSGFGFVGRDEEKWAKSTESDLESFAQTKAVSRALRNGISYLIKAAGYSTTPAEEMYGLKGISKSMGAKKPKLPPIYGVPDSDFIFDRPEYRPERPIQKPIEKAVIKERSNLSILLQKVWAESKGRGMVIVSPEFMDKIEGALFDTDATDTLFKVLLTDAYEWMISNNRQLRSKRFMNEIQRAISGLEN